MTYQESDIYTCRYRDCDHFSYHCHDASDYSEMGAMRTEGVAFLSSVETYRTYGCAPVIWDDKVYPGCPGHSVSVCFGHKDIEIYLKQRYMDAFFEKEGTLPFD